MSHIDSGPLSTYNSLQDKHLVGYFNNSRMQRHLCKSGLITRHGEIVTESTYRLNMARREHQKHVRDLMAQAIVHKALDMERNRQADIRLKLEEISKVELVRRVRTARRQGDEDITPYLSPHAPTSRPRSANVKRSRAYSGTSTRPSTAPSHRSSKKSVSAVYLDEDGHPVHRERPRNSLQADSKEIDSQNLRELDQHILDRISLSLKVDDQFESLSPYRVDLTQPKPPPKSQQVPRSSRRLFRSGKQSTSPGRRKLRQNEPRTNKHSLALHRKEPAYQHVYQLQSMCDVTVRYRGSNIKLNYERADTRDEIQVYQQHCGGENLLVFHGLVEPKTDIVFTSRRHRGYPFAATFFLNRVEDLRLSTCCEYKYAPGVLLGGKKGHFKFIRAEGSSPCYRCMVEAELARRERQRYRGTQTQISKPEPDADPEIAAQGTQTSPTNVPPDQTNEIDMQVHDYHDNDVVDDFNEDAAVMKDNDQYSDQFSSESEDEVKVSVELSKNEKYSEFESGSAIKDRPMSEDDEELEDAKAKKEENKPNEKYSESGSAIKDRPMSEDDEELEDAKAKKEENKPNEKYSESGSAIKDRPMSEDDEELEDAKAKKEENKPNDAQKNDNVRRKPEESSDSEGDNLVLSSTSDSNTSDSDSEKVIVLSSELSSDSEDNSRKSNIKTDLAKKKNGKANGIKRNDGTVKGENEDVKDSTRPEKSDVIISTRKNSVENKETFPKKDLPLEEANVKDTPATANIDDHNSLDKNNTIPTKPNIDKEHGEIVVKSKEIDKELNEAEQKDDKKDKSKVYAKLSTSQNLHGNIDDLREIKDDEPSQESSAIDVEKLTSVTIPKPDDALPDYTQQSSEKDEDIKPESSHVNNRDISVSEEIKVEPNQVPSVPDKENQTFMEIPKCDDNENIKKDGDKNENSEAIKTPTINGTNDDINVSEEMKVNEDSQHHTVLDENRSYSNTGFEIDVESQAESISDLRNVRKNEVKSEDDIKSATDTKSKIDSKSDDDTKADDTKFKDDTKPESVTKLDIVNKSEKVTEPENDNESEYNTKLEYDTKSRNDIKPDSYTKLEDVNKSGDATKSSNDTKSENDAKFENDIRSEDDTKLQNYAKSKDNTKSKSDTKSDTKSEDSSRSEDDTKSENDTKAETDTLSKIDVNIKDNSKSQDDTILEDNSKSEDDTKSEIDINLDNDAESENDIRPDVTTSEDVKSLDDTKLANDTKSEDSTNSDDTKSDDAQSEVDAKLESDTISGDDTKLENDTKSEDGTKSENETESEIDTNSDIDAKSDINESENTNSLNDTKSENDIKSENGTKSKHDTKSENKTKLEDHTKIENYAISEDDTYLKDKADDKINIAEEGGAPAVYDKDISTDSSSISSLLETKTINNVDIPDLEEKTDVVLMEEQQTDESEYDNQEIWAKSNNRKDDPGTNKTNPTSKLPDDIDDTGGKQENTTELSVSKSPLSPESESDGDQTDSVKVLNLTDRKLDPKKAKKFARSLLKPKYDNVEVLLLKDNPIGDQGMTAIVRSLKEKAMLFLCDNDEDDETKPSRLKITNINLSNCQLENKGIVELAELLKHNTKIENLDLSNNHFGVIGCKALAIAIRENNTLKTLHLQHASLGDEGCKTIAEAVSDHKKIEELKIEGNDFGEDGGQAILQLVKHNSVIKQIQFEKDNYVSVETTKLIKEILETDPNVPKITLDQYD